ncbi:uncharacterized protein LOC144716452 [Wolffia australiana]
MKVLKVATAAWHGGYEEAAVVFSLPYIYFVANLIIVVVIALSSSLRNPRENTTLFAEELVKFLAPPEEEEEEAVVVVPERPLLSARFSLRRSPKMSSEGKPLGVAKPKKKANVGSSAETVGKEETLWGVRREASLGKEDLHCRAEEFIMKVKGDIRLRRQESFKRFSQTISRRTPTLGSERFDERLSAF